MFQTLLLTAALASATPPAEAHTDALLGPPPNLSFTERNELIDFEFDWSAEAAAVPELVRQFRREIEQERADLLRGARLDRAAAHDPANVPFLRYGSTTLIDTVGSSTHLLSLSRSHSAYRGGPTARILRHAILWDRSTNQEIEFASLFVRRSSVEQLLSKSWCDARTQYWGEELGDCPSIYDVAIIPSDEDGNGRFERLRIAVSDYVDGANGYDIDLATTSDLVAALKAEYRLSFEAQTQ